MGCDIHFYVETLVDGVWKTADSWEMEYEALSVPYQKAFYSDRNYDLFAIFADVRNGFGFAGTPTGRGFVPISAPRGIPADCCQEYRDAVAHWNGDGHSHSFLLVSEFQSYDWTQTTVKSGWVTRSQYARFKINGEPNSWCGMISGMSVQHISNSKMEALDQKNGKYNPWAQFHAKEDGLIANKEYTQIEWEVSYHHAAKGFLAETLPRLWRLGAPDKVRCLFFFDN